MGCMVYYQRNRVGYRFGSPDRTNQVTGLLWFQPDTDALQKIDLETELTSKRWIQVRSAMLLLAWFNYLFYQGIAINRSLFSIHIFP